MEVRLKSTWHLQPFSGLGPSTWLRNVTSRIRLPGLYNSYRTYAIRTQGIPEISVPASMQLQIFIPVTRRVKGYTRFVGKYVTGRRKRFRPHKVYTRIFLIRITSRVNLAMSVCPSVRLSVRMNAEISETMEARLLRFGVQIP